MMKKLTSCMGVLGGLLLSLNSSATIIDGTVTSGSGNWIYLSDPSGVVVGNDTFDDPNLRGFNEDQNIIFDQDITAYTSWNWNNDTVGGTESIMILDGTEVASHYIFFDPGPTSTMEGWVQFDSDILGIIVDTDTLLATDSLINNTVTYLNPDLRGLEDYQDWVRIDPLNSDTIELHFTASTPGDYIRVLTAFSPTADVPEPATWLLIFAGLIGIGLGRKRMQRAAVRMQPDQKR